MTSIHPTSFAYPTLCVRSQLIIGMECTLEGNNCPIDDVDLIRVTPKHINSCIHISIMRQNVTYFIVCNIV